MQGDTANSKLNGPLPVTPAQTARTSKQAFPGVTIPPPGTPAAQQLGWFPVLGANGKRLKLIIQNPSQTALGNNNITSIFLFRGSANPPGTLNGGMEITPGKTLYEDVIPSPDIQFVRLGALLGPGDSLQIFTEEA